MSGCLRRNISKGEDVFVLIYNVGGYLFVYEFVEDGLGHKIRL